MRRVGNLSEKIVDYENIQLAFMKARRGKARKAEVNKFLQNFDRNIEELRLQLLSGDIKVGNYHYFKIKDPKERKICAAPFSERVLHHAIMNVCHEYFDRTLISDTYATRPGRGVYTAIDRAKYYQNKYRYVVKLDYRKYYDSISHDLLKQRLRRLFKDKHLLEMFDKIIDSYECTPGKGLPIGNLTSQYFANYYLSAVDHLMKNERRIPGYVRYMDDIVMYGNDRDMLKEEFELMKEYSVENLGLTLKSPVFTQTVKGVAFLGYKIYPHHIQLNGRSKRRYREKVLDYEHKLEKGIWNEQTYHDHIVPVVAFAERASSFGFRKSCMEIKGYLSML